MEASWKPPETRPLSLRSALTLDAAVGLGSLRASRSKWKIRYSSDSPDLPSLHFRFGDGLDGRRQIGSTPAAGDVRNADAPRAPRQAPPTYGPDEARGPRPRREDLALPRR